MATGRLSGDGALAKLHGRTFWVYLLRRLLTSPSTPSPSPPLPFSSSPPRFLSPPLPLFLFLTLHSPPFSYPSFLPLFLPSSSSSLPTLSPTFLSSLFRSSSLPLPFPFLHLYPPFPFFYPFSPSLFLLPFLGSSPFQLYPFSSLVLTPILSSSFSASFPLIPSSVLFPLFMF